MGPCYANFGNKADLIHHALESQKLAAKRDVVRCEVWKICTVYMLDATYFVLTLSLLHVNFMYVCMYV